MFAWVNCAFWEKVTSGDARTGCLNSLTETLTAPGVTISPNPIAKPDITSANVFMSQKKDNFRAGDTAYRRIVVKVGTGVLTDTRSLGGLNLPVMEDLVRQISLLKQDNSTEIVLVTSGAIAAGRQELKQSGLSLTERDIPSRQALAAIGQGGLIHTYHGMFEAYGVHVAQALLTINDLADRQSYLNVRNTLTALLDIGVVPILNENDVVAVDEIGAVFGDNDRLSALVTNLVDADLLVILTDTEGLYTADPFRNPDATLIPVVEQIDDRILAAVGHHRNHWARGECPPK